MPRAAYFDTFSGISGDMTLGALVDAGLSLERLREGLRSIQLSGYELRAEKVHRGAFQATRFRVVLDGQGSGGSTPSQSHSHGHEHGHSHSHEHTDSHEHGHQHRHAHDHAASGQPQRNLTQILALIRESGLPEPVKATASRVFDTLGRAESRMHGIPLDSVHFHEVGAVDSIVDICGACLGLHLLGVEEVWFSKATVGTGFVHGAHGQMPLPAPATLELLQGIPLVQRETGFELTTPTGAALTKTLGRGFGPMPPLTPSAVGYGAGNDRPGPIPNLLRVVIGERTAARRETDRVLCLEAAIDDSSPQWLGHLMDRLLEAGALDVSVTPILMKKGRAAHEVRVLGPLELEEKLADILFRESTTFGIRRSEFERLLLEREFRVVATPWGDVRVKVGRRDGRILSAMPEYEDLREIAQRTGEPLREIQRRAIEEFHKTQGAGDSRSGK